MTEKEVVIETKVPKNVMEFLEHLSNCHGWRVNVWLRREIRMAVDEATSERHPFWDGPWLREKYQLEDFLKEGNDADETLNCKEYPT